MGRTIFVALALILCALPLNAQNVWSAKIDLFGNFVKQPSFPNAGPVISRFTPDTGITVTRMQLQAASGGLGCSPLAAVVLTDGSTRVRIPIPNGEPNQNFAGPSSSDSGPISASFPQGANLVLKVLAGSLGCNPFEVSITVQYRITGQ